MRLGKLRFQHKKRGILNKKAFRFFYVRLGQKTTKQQKSSLTYAVYVLEFAFSISAHNFLVFSAQTFQIILSKTSKMIRMSFRKEKSLNLQSRLNG